MKDKRIEIRVSEKFFNLITALAEKSNKTKTQLITERCLTGKLNRVEVNHCDEQMKQTLSGLSDKINQQAKTINEILRTFKEAERNGTVYEKFIDMDFTELTNQYKICANEFQKISQRLENNETSFYQMKIHDELIPEVIEYVAYNHPEFFETMLNQKK